MRIGAGVHNIHEYEENSVEVRSTDFTVHERYDYDYGSNIAIIRLKEPLEFNNYVSSIEMNFVQSSFHGK